MDRSKMVQQIDVSTPLEHYQNHEETYNKIDDKLEKVNQKFRRGTATERRSMLRTAHRFAVLSIQANVEKHEEAFKELEGLPAENNAVQSLNYWKQKMDWINDLDGKTHVLDSVAEELAESNTDKAHKLLIDNVKGLGAKKAAFTIAMLGFTGKMCLDTNLQQVAEIDDVYSGVVVSKYEDQCSTVLQQFKSLRTETGNPFMTQWVLFDYQRGEISEHKCFFDAMEV